jgi:hypothetical protein
MKLRHHIEGREGCPFLPPAPTVIRPADNRPLRDGNDQGAYYTSCLTCAQSLWLEGKPAQALLQLNHALAVELATDSPSVIRWPLPYRAKVWIFTRRHETGFMGNPVRHYQHLATRVSGPLKELRSWRAWACFHLAERTLPRHEYPRDEQQIIQENLTIPGWDDVMEALHSFNKTHEAALLAMCIP